MPSSKTTKTYESPKKLTPRTVRTSGADTNAETTSDAKADAKAETKAETKADTQADTKAETTSDAPEAEDAEPAEASE